jgi:hypothetical protein
MRLALGEFSDLFLASQRVIPSAALDLGFVFGRPTLEAAFAKGDGPLRLRAVRRGVLGGMPETAVPRPPPTVSSRPQARASELESRDLLPLTPVE